jgi:hypothetical protein
VKTVRLSWRELAGVLLGWYGSDAIGRKKLDVIQHHHTTDEACLKAVVEAFLLGEGPYQPSWRMLIRRLYKAGETHAAEKIKTNAEPHEGEC